MEQSHINNFALSFENNKLSYCGQDCVKIPPVLSKLYGAKVHYLDLSYNSVETLKGLDRFLNLQELIFDNNKLGDGVSFPYLPHLRTLSLNNNQITDLETIVDKISKSFPCLTYLSLLRNVACPDQLTDQDKDSTDYQRYRYFVIYKLNHLRFLDSRSVSPREREEAETRGQFTLVRRPPPPPPPPPTPPKPTRVALGSGTSPLVSAQRTMPVDFNSLGKHKGAYGKCRYRYTGKHSEGNRFIVNSDL